MFSDSLVYYHIPALPAEMDSQLIRERRMDFNSGIKAKLSARDNTLDMCIGSAHPDTIINVERAGRTLGETFTSTRDLWEGYIKSIPLEPSYEEAAMEKFDKYICQQTTIKKSDGSCILLHG